jgi:hypothetical protein
MGAQNNSAVMSKRVRSSLVDAWVRHSSHSSFHNNPKLLLLLCLLQFTQS